MKNYIKPTADVINVAVRESLSARYRERQYTVNGKSKTINTAIYTQSDVSEINYKKSEQS